MKLSTEGEPVVSRVSVTWVCLTTEEGRRKDAVPHSIGIWNHIEKETLSAHRGRKIMETKLERISQLSKENPNMVFTSIGHLINKEMLKKCHETMQKDKATGIDGITKEEYEKHQCIRKGQTPVRKNEDS